MSTSNSRDDDTVRISNTSASIYNTSSTSRDKNSRRNVNEGPTNEVSSNVIRNFDGENDEEQIIQYDDNLGFDAVFGRNIPKGNNSHDNTSSHNNNSHVMQLENALLKERRNKLLLFTLLIIVTITCLSTIMSQKRLLRLQEQQSQNINGYDYGGGYDNAKGYGGHGGKDYQPPLKEKHESGNGIDTNANANADAYQNHPYNNGLYDNEDQSTNDGFFGPSSSSGDKLGDTNNNNFQESWSNPNEEENYGQIDKQKNESNNQQENQPINNEQEQDISNKEEPPFTINTNNNFGEVTQKLIEKVKEMNIADLSAKFGNVDIPFKNSGYEIPFLFYIPRTGAALQEQLITKCHGVVAASGQAILGDGHINEQVSIFSLSLCCQIILTIIKTNLNHGLNFIISPSRDCKSFWKLLLLNQMNNM